MGNEVEQLKRVQLIPIKSSWTCPACERQNVVGAHEHAGGFGGPASKGKCSNCDTAVILGVERASTPPPLTPEQAKERARLIVVEVFGTEPKWTGLNTLLARLRDRIAAEIVATPYPSEGEADDDSEEVQAEQGRWQDAIREHLVKACGIPDADSWIDGAGCDSGDPLDVSLAEISQVINHFIDAADPSTPSAPVPGEHQYRGDLWIDPDGTTNFKFHIPGGDFIAASCVLQKFIKCLQDKLIRAEDCPYADLFPLHLNQRTNRIQGS